MQITEIRPDAIASNSHNLEKSWLVDWQTSRIPSVYAPRIKIDDSDFHVGLESSNSRGRAYAKCEHRTSKATVGHYTAYESRSQASDPLDRLMRSIDYSRLCSRFHCNWSCDVARVWVDTFLVELLPELCEFSKRSCV